VSTIERLQKQCEDVFSSKIPCRRSPQGQIHLTVPSDHLLDTFHTLKTRSGFQFDMLMDLAGIDYLHFRIPEWTTEEATERGFSRGVEVQPERANNPPLPTRFSVVYQLLSIALNHRITVHTFIESDPPCLPSVVPLWPSANWYEREAFDLFGFLFEGHPDLRRILTDYDFVGHPFRKDFPLIGHVEMRYDAKQQRVIYEPVSITPRVLVPKVIRASTREEMPKSDSKAEN